MPIFPNQYPEKLNPKNEDKILLADSESGSAIKSVQAKKVADLVLPITNDKISDGAVTNDKLADNSVTASKMGDGAVTASKIDNRAVTASKMETVLYNSTASNVVTLSDTYTNYSQLKITYQWNGQRNSVVMDTMHSKIHFPVSASGQFGGNYRLYLGDGLITCSGNTMAGGTAGSIYTLVTGPGVAPYWIDAGEIQIIKVVGIKK